MAKEEKEKKKRAPKTEGRKKAENTAKAENAEKTGSTVKAEPEVKEREKMVAVKSANELDHEVKNNVSDDDTALLFNYLKINSIPSDIPDGLLVTGIAKVLKRDGSVSWCVLRRVTFDVVRIEKIFGSCSAIAKVGTHIPLETIPEEMYVSFEKGDKKSRVDFICDYEIDRPEDLYAKTEEQLDKEILRIQIEKYEKASK